MSNARINLFWLVIFGLTLPVSVVVATHLARRSFEKVQLRGQTITVKGYAEHPIVADRGSWSADVVVRNAQRTDAYVQLEADRAKLMSLLASQGFPAQAVQWEPVHIGTLYAQDEEGNSTNEIEKYVLSQAFSIEANDVQKIAKVAREASGLIREGVELQADRPRYLYTKLDEMKMQMLAEAGANARERAEHLVANSSSRLGGLQSATQGVFQITPAHSTEVSNSGYNDTASIDKMIKAVVTVEYAIE